MRIDYEYKKRKENKKKLNKRNKEESENLEERAIIEIIDLLKKDNELKSLEYNKQKYKLNLIKSKVSNKYSLKKIPSDIKVYTFALKLSERKKLSKEELKEIREILLSKPSRTLSGVTVCAVMTEPSPCPHGKCSYCPGGVNSYFGNVPQSYTGKEPASMRAERNNYDPYLQVMNRLEQYVAMGHPIEKIELIIMGGTFPALKKEYQKEFIMYCFKALNDFSRLFLRKYSSEIEINYKKFTDFFLLPGDIENEERTKEIKKRLLKIKSESSLKKEQDYNDKRSKIKCVGLTIETRPDYGFKEQGIFLLELGATRIELGVQTTDNRVLEKINRGHTVEESIKSTRELKDLGFKINYHIMLGLPGTNYKEDIETFHEIFGNPDFRPDMLKIYPTLIIKGTELYMFWKENKYKPINDEYALKLLTEIYPKIPEYVRIMRIERDIPSTNIDAGIMMTNLRQELQKRINERLRENPKEKIMEIRSREIGHNKDLFNDQEIKKTKIFVKEYEASKGIEYFISLEDENRKVLYGFCRLRFPSSSLIEIVDTKTAFIRELHVYGKSTDIGSKGEIQHKGIGKALLRKAEEIAKEHNKTKILIISGIGVREYYRKQGYKKRKYYMYKNLSLKDN